MTVRWQVFLPPYTNPGNHKTSPKRLLGIILRDSRGMALLAARARYGPLADVQSVLAVEAEKDDLSAVRRTRKLPVEPKTYRRIRVCQTCGEPTGNGHWYCEAHDTPDLRIERETARRAQCAAERRASGVCQWPGCSSEAKPVKPHGHRKWCESHAATVARVHG